MVKSEIPLVGTWLELDDLDEDGAFEEEVGTFELLCTFDAVLPPQAPKTIVKSNAITPKESCFFILNSSFNT